MQITRRHSSTSNILRVKLRSSATGAGLTSLTSASSGLIISTICDNEPTATAYTVAASNVETITTLATYAAPTSGKCRFKEVDATNHPGLYEIQLADARYSVSGAKVLRVNLSGAANLLDAEIIVQLDLDLTHVAGTAQTGGDLAALISTLTAFVDTEVAAIKAKTDNLPADPADASDIAASLATLIGYVDTEVAAILAAVDTEVAAIKAKTDNLPADPADASDLAALLAAITGYIDTEIADIKAKTDNLPADPADASDIAASLATLIGYVDTEVAAIKAKTDLISVDMATAATQLLTAMEADGGGGWQFSTLALENAPSGSGLTAQQARDAMKLAPTPGAPAAGSVDEHLDTIVTNTGSLSGSGSYAITCTVTDGTDPIQNAKVRIGDGVDNPMQTTDVDGQCSFSLDAGTYTVSITKGGYSFTPITRTVTGIQSGTLVNDLEMTEIVTAAPSAPDMCVLTGTVLYPDGSVAAGVTLRFELMTATVPAAGGNVVARAARSVTTNTSGEIELSGGDPFELIRTDADGMPTSAYYKVTCDGVTTALRLTLTAASYDLATLFAQ